MLISAYGVKTNSYTKAMTVFMNTCNFLCGDFEVYLNLHWDQIIKRSDQTFPLHIFVSCYKIERYILSEFFTQNYLHIRLGVNLCKYELVWPSILIIYFSKFLHASKEHSICNIHTQLQVYIFLVKLHVNFPWTYNNDL